MTAGFQQQEPSRSGRAAFSTGTPEKKRDAAASHLAHDARNWLTVLQVYCDLLRSSGAVTGQGRTWMEELSNAVERGQGLVISLLDSAQTSTPLEFAPQRKAASSKMLDLTAVIQAREPLLRQMAGSAIRVESQMVAGAETTALQEPEFDRILLNLVRNGIDAMPRGGRLTIELERGAASEGRRLVLRVSDTGKGIPAGILPHIFESGFSTKSTAQRTKTGRGYGLAIVRELALAAGGSAQVRSRVGHGTCFTIELPAQLAAATPRLETSQPRNIGPGSKRARRTNARTRQTNNFGSHRKGTRVPC